MKPAAKPVHICIHCNREHPSKFAQKHCVCLNKYR